MPGSRALKEITLCNEGRSKPVGGKKESAPVTNSKQYVSPKASNTGPNYPQWHLGSKDTIKGI